MFEKLNTSNNYMLSSELSEFVASALDEGISNEKAYFANGRMARNIYDILATNQACRVSIVEYHR